jgi:hypothetical protein
MAVFKRVLCKQRLRQVPPQFSWIDHRLVRDRHISRCSADALALYLFLVTVADGQGLSYYADATLCRLLPLRQARAGQTPDEPALDEQTLDRARRELIDNRLIAWQRPLYQVLALGPPPPAPQALSSQQIQSSPRRPAPPRPQPGRPAGLQSTGVAPPAPSNVEVGEAGEPHPLARIFRSMALDSAPLDTAPLDVAPPDVARSRPFDGAQDRQDRPLDSASQRKTP